MVRKIVALPGDGIGPEVVEAALRVLEWCRGRHGLELDVEVLPVGGQALDELGEPLPDFVLRACLESGVVLLGAVGAPRFDRHPPENRPEKALLRLRQEMQLYANLRPVRLYPALSEASPLKPEVIRGTDLLFVRELTGGIYFGQPRGLQQRAGQRVGINTEVYSEAEIERIARVAFEAARLRRRRVHSVDKSNVLESSQLWRTVVEEVSRDYPEVELLHILVDNCAMQLIAAPSQFDVVLTSNMFGDILSDEAAMLTGSIGMLPSASLGAAARSERAGLYEPVHGSAPDIAGQGKANPLATIQSLALMFRYSLSRDDVAAQIEQAVEAVLEQGLRTADLSRSGEESASTRDVTDALLTTLEASLD